MLNSITISFFLLWWIGSILVQVDPFLGQCFKTFHTIDVSFRNRDAKSAGAALVHEVRLIPGNHASRVVFGDPKAELHQWSERQLLATAIAHFAHHGVDLLHEIIAQLGTPLVDLLEKCNKINYN